MAKKQPPEVQTKPEVSPATAIDLLSKQIETGEALEQKPGLTGDEFGQWELLTKNFLEKAFGQNTSNVKSVTDVGKFGMFPTGAGEAWWVDHRKKSLRTKLSRLRGLVELLSTDLQLQSGSGIQPAEAPPVGRRVFLVHGHDKSALEGTARFLERLKLEPIVLHEQADQGQTIIEKFERHSDVGFAVVLLMGDDMGAPKGKETDLKPRARQNVIFELGFFVGRLTRRRVCALYQAGVELPSDISGVLYKPLDDNGGWRMGLAKELKEAGFPIDMNDAV